jgi:hypothetical protein
VFAPNSSWRAAVVPSAPTATAAPPGKAQKTRAKKKTAGAPSSILADGVAPTPGVGPSSSNRTASSLASRVVMPVGARIDWASLLKRTFLEDVLACPCGGRRRILADVEHPAVIVAILAHLGLPTEPPPLARARTPTFDPA